MTQIAWRIKEISVVRSGTYSVHETGWKSAARSCILPGLPAHLVQELNAGTVLTNIIMIEMKIKNATILVLSMIIVLSIILLIIN